MAKEKSNLIKLTSNLSSFDYSKVGEPHYTDLKRNVASERGQAQMLIMKNYLQMTDNLSKRNQVKDIEEQN